MTWRIDPKTGEILSGDHRSPFRCKSWRHPGDCRRWIASQNFSRLNTALLKVRHQDVLLLVLTLNPARKAHGKAWRSPYEAFGELVRCWRKFRQSVTRTWGENRYASTVEVTRAGWPHLNVVLVCPALARTLGTGGLTARGLSGTAKARAAVAWAKRAAVAAGFGYMLTVERAKSRRAVAGYAIKVAGDLEQAAGRARGGGTAGEVVKLSQLPMAAPRHFRRLRASIRFLPRPFKREDVTGKLVKEPLPRQESRA